MLNLRKKRYPLEYLLGLNEFLYLFLDSHQYIYVHTTFLLLMLFKYKLEGFRVSIIVFMFGKVLSSFTNSAWVGAIAAGYFMYFAHGLVVFKLPEDGPPVGHLWIRGGWIEKYNIQEMSIFYPAEATTGKVGFPWLKCNDYSSRMNDTAKKDVKRKRNTATPLFFFQVVATQFYRMKMFVYERANIKHQDKYPILLLSHGLASHCDGYSVVARYFAQQGYIVFCPEHIEHVRNILPTDEENRIYRLAQLYNRFNVMRACLDIVYQKGLLNEKIPHLPTTKIEPDLSNVSILGHSFGGTTALYSTIHDKRITGACISYDPCLYLYDDHVVSLDVEELTIPVICINADDFYRRLYPFMDNDKRLEDFFNSIPEPLKNHSIQLYIGDQQHADFSDLPIIWNGESGLYKISRNVHEIHLRFGIILELSKAFLTETAKYRSQTNNKNHNIESLKESLLSSLNFDPSAKKLIRWTALPQK